MKNITFLEVGMKNYGPYIDPMVLTFESDKLTLITGPNGIGKTMAIDAIPFTLYGVTSKGARGDDVVNNKIGKNCKTWVKFKVNDDKYKVTRYHKYTKYNNTVIVNLNGVDIKQGHKEVLPLIERIICPQKAFMNALMFGQKVKDFFTDLPDSQKKEIFRKVLDLEMFLTYYKFADQAYKDVNEQRSELDKRIQINIGLLEDTKEQIELLKKSKVDFFKQKEERIAEKNKSIEESTRLLNQWTKSLEGLEKNHDIKLEDTITNLATIESTLKDLAQVFSQRFKDLDNRKQTKILELKGAAQNAEVEIKDKHMTLLVQLQDKRVEIKQALSDKIAELQEEKHELEIKKNRLENSCSSLDGRIEEIQTHVIDHDISECPLCEQTVDEVTIKTLEDKIAGYRQEIKQYLQEIGQFNTKITEVNRKLSEESNKANDELKHNDSEQNAVKRAQQEEYSAIRDKLETATSKVLELAKQEEQNIKQEENTKSSELQEQKNELLEKRKIQEEKLSEIESIKENVRNIQNDIKQSEQRIKEIEASEYDESQLNNYMKKEREYKIAIKTAKERVSRFDELQEVASFWKTGFSATGIPSMLIDEAVPFMNERVEHYLDMLTNGRYVVSFDTLAETKAGEFRDKISVHVLDTQTRANSRVQLSGGQTRIIDIAIILTLGDLLSNIQNISFNILLFDEIFDALDEQNIQYVSKVLSKIKIGKCIYIISHQHQDHLEADQTLAFS